MILVIEKKLQNVRQQLNRRRLREHRLGITAATNIVWTVYVARRSLKSSSCMIATMRSRDTSINTIPASASEVHCASQGATEEKHTEEKEAAM
jgi:hypothetical protein